MGASVCEPLEGLRDNELILIMAMMLVVLTQSPVHGVISTSPRAKTGGLLLSVILSRRNSS